MINKIKKKTKRKYYGLFLIRNNTVYGLGFNRIFTNSVQILTKDELIEKLTSKNLKKFKKYLKKGFRIVPIRLSREKYPLPIEIVNFKPFNVMLSFKYIDKVERRKRKLKQL